VVRAYITYALLYFRNFFNKTFLPAAPTNVIMYLHNNPKLATQFKVLWFIHGVQYYIFKHIDVKLFANTRDYRSKPYARPV